MVRRLAILAVALTAGLAPSGASAASQDVTSTHAYLVAAHTVLQGAVSKWSIVEGAIHKLNLRLRGECPNVGAGSPQSEEEQKLSSEVAGALWATGYSADAKLVRGFVKAVSPLKWSNPAITRSAHKLAKAMHDMTVIGVPDLCGDVRAWTAGGYKAVSAATVLYDQRMEAIEIKEIPRRLLLPFVQPSDRGLVTQDERLYTEFGELEFQRGQDDWNLLLETLAINQ